MRQDSSQIAEALLDAHVQYVVSLMTGPGLREYIENELDALLADAARLKLKDVVTSTMIKDTARRFAVDMEPGGGLPELVAEIARVLYAHPIHERVAPKDLITHERYVETVEKLLEMRSLREQLVREIAASPIYIAFASDLLYQGIKGYLSRSGELTRNIPGAGSVMKLGKSVMNRATPKLESTLDEGLKNYVERSVTATARASAEFMIKHLSDDALREMSRDIWDRMKFVPLSDIRPHLSSDDLEDLFVHLYEFWREFRHTEFYSSMIDTAIDVLFEIYGNATLAELLAEIGVDREHMLEEAMRYGPYVAKVLKRKKLLEPMVRRQLAGFYRSGAVEKVLGGE